MLYGEIRKNVRDRITLIDGVFEIVEDRLLANDDAGGSGTIAKRTTRAIAKKHGDCLAVYRVGFLLDFAKLAPITLETGHSLLLDVTEVYSVGPTAGVPILNKVPHVERLFQNTGKSDHRTLLLITGTVVIVEEKEVQQPVLEIPK